MEKATISKTIGASTYSISKDGKLIILASGQPLGVYEPGEALELLQWLYANRDLLLEAAYPAGVPGWTQERKTSEQDTETQGLRHAFEQRQSEQETDAQGPQHAFEQRRGAATEESASTFSIRIVEEPLTPHNLTSILSAITELSTKCWLIGSGRFADLIKYTQTSDVRFVEEAQLIITRITYNSPFAASFNIDLSASNLAEAIVTAIDGVTQAKKRLERAELENKAKAQEIAYAQQKANQESKATLLEHERQELAIERERLGILEQRLEVQKKGIEYALEIATRTVTVLQPNTDEQTKAMLIQILLPTLLQLQNGKGLELTLFPLTGEDTISIF